MGLVHLLGALALSAASALAPARGPVATAAAWKAVDLGAPRVIKVDDGYTLFYEYRAVEDAGNADMPPAMSTGRLGRATSDDGLVFPPRADGLGAAGSVLSASDDWFAFDSGHVGLGDVLWGGDAQFLYTYGGSNAPVARSELGLDGDGDVVGMDLKMGVCVSQDGVHWGRIEGDEFVLNGQKTWSTRAVWADWAFCMFRTDPNSERHRGLTFILVPLDTPGITVRPIPQLDGLPGFAEIFFDNVRVPVNNRLGDEGAGWSVAMATAGFERGLMLRSPARFQETARRLVNLYKG